MQDTPSAVRPKNFPFEQVFLLFREREGISEALSKEMGFF
jgi:hypothetical protein